MTTHDGKAFREQLRLLVRSLGLMEKTSGPAGAISIAQCHALVELGRREPLSLNDLAEILGVDKSTMSRTVSHLDRAKLVTREIDLQNRRYIALRLTDKGREAFEGIEESSGGYYQDIFDLIPAGKQGQVLESLELVIKALGEKDRR